MGLSRRRVGLLLGCMFWCARAPAGTAASDFSFQQMAARGVETLQQWYSWTTGLWNTTGWWNSANALTALVNYSQLSGSTSYQPVVENTYARHASRGFLNNYYDDEGWWALAWVNAYDWTGDSKYLEMASSIFDDMTSG